MMEASRASSPIKALLCWTVAVASAWLAVGSQPWPLTFLIFAVGALYLVFPPLCPPPKSFLILFGLLLLLSTTAFLPATWFPEAYRKPFLDRDFILPSTFSLQPWLSLEDFTLLLSTLLWAWLCFETNLALEQRQFLITSYLIALGLIALNFVVLGAHPSPNIPVFLRDAGRFSNRNQTGDLLVMGGIYSFCRALSNLSKQRTALMPWMILTTIFLAAIIRNGSRAALVLFGIGLLIAYFWTPKARRYNRLVLVALYIMVLLGSLLFIFKGADLRERFSLMLTSGRDGRLAIYHDTLSMIARDPWVGVGLGNFEGVYNTERVHSIHLEARSLHPESDWLWIGAELGIGGIIIAGLLIFLSFRIYLSKSPYAALTQASLLVGILFLIHSILDVGGHRLGTVWNCIYLVSLGAFRSGPTTVDSRVLPLVLRGAGLLLLAIAFLRIQSVSLHPWMPTRASLAEIAEALAFEPPLVQRKHLLDQGIQWSPLDWYLYYLRGLNLVQGGSPASASSADFGRALYLEQTSIKLPISIGDVCRNSDMPEAIVAWKDILQRAGPYKVEYFDFLFLYPDLDAKSRLELSMLSGADPNLETIAIMRQNPPEFDYLRQNYLDDNPTLKGIRPVLLNQFFNRWLNVGDTSELIEQWPLHPSWQAAGWKAYAKALARAGRYPEAVAIVLKFIPHPAMPDFPAHSDRAEAERSYQSDAQDPLNGIMLYFAQMDAGLNDEALNTLYAIAKLPQHPVYIQYLLAQKLAAAHQDADAWQALDPLLDLP